MSVNLPASNTQYIKEDETQFYISQTINERHDVSVLAGQFISACENAFAVARILRSAADAGVGKAATLAALIGSTETFSDEATAGAFITAFRAAMAE